VKRVKLRFADGRTLTMRPVTDFFLFAIPHRYPRIKRQLAFIRGYDAPGQSFSARRFCSSSQTQSPVRLDEQRMAPLP